MRPASRQEEKARGGGLIGKKGKIPEKGKEEVGRRDEENWEYGRADQFGLDQLDRRIRAGSGSVEKMMRKIKERREGK